MCQHDKSNSYIQIEISCNKRFHQHNYKFSYFHNIRVANMDSCSHTSIYENWSFSKAVSLSRSSSQSSSRSSLLCSHFGIVQHYVPSFHTPSQSFINKPGRIWFLPDSSSATSSILIVLSSHVSFLLKLDKILALIGKYTRMCIESSMP